MSGNYSAGQFVSVRAVYLNYINVGDAHTIQLLDSVTGVAIHTVTSAQLDAWTAGGDAVSEAATYTNYDITVPAPNDVDAGETPQ